MDPTPFLPFFLCSQVMREREASNEVIVDQDATIKKFRELVQKQQEQNLDLRHSLEKETNKPIGTPSEIIDFKVTPKTVGEIH